MVLIDEADGLIAVELVLENATEKSVFHVELVYQLAT
jgi:hypothetical protein